MTVTIHARHGERLGCSLGRTSVLLWLYGLVVIATGLFVNTGNGASGPPQIVTQPTNVIAREGELVSFTVQVDGTPPLSVQWQQNGEPIPGATGLSLTTAPLTVSENGDNFSVLVSNSLGEVTSSNAVLTVTNGLLLALSANHAGEPVLYPGWPLVLELALIHPDLYDSNAIPFLLSTTNGSWINALNIEVRNGSGQLETWPWHAAPFTNDVVSVTAAAGVRMFWWLTPTETGQLPPGEFQITASLNTTNANKPGAWKGLLRGVPVSLSMSNAPPPVGELPEEQKRRLLADYARLQGNLSAAQTEIDALLSAYPANIGGLTYNAYLKRDARSFEAALQSVQLALEQVDLQSPQAPEPPVALLHFESELSQLIAPPVLEVSQVGQQLAINWNGYPALFIYRLEASGDLKTWSSVTTEITVVGNRFSVTTDLVPNRRFFRVVR